MKSQLNGVFVMLTYVSLVITTNFIILVIAYQSSTKPADVLRELKEVETRLERNMRTDPWTGENQKAWAESLNRINRDLRVPVPNQLLSPPMKKESR